MTTFCIAAEPTVLIPRSVARLIHITALELARLDGNMAIGRTCDDGETFAYIQRAPGQLNDPTHYVVGTIVRDDYGYTTFDALPQAIEHMQHLLRVWSTPLAD